MTVPCLSGCPHLMSLTSNGAASGVPHPSCLEILESPPRQVFFFLSKRVAPWNEVKITSVDTFKLR